jgi:hypothetical protein
MLWQPRMLSAKNITTKIETVLMLIKHLLV